MRVEGHPPVVVVHEVVVLAADGDEHLEVGEAVVVPLDGVMDLAVGVRHTAPGDCAVVVDRGKGTPLIRCCRARFAPDVERNRVAAEQHGDDPGVARQPPDGCRCERLPVVVVVDGAGVEPVAQRVVVDVDDDLGASRTLRRVTARNQVAERVAGELPARDAPVRPLAGAPAG